LQSVEYLGLAAGVLTTFSTVPQIIRVYKLKSARDISFIYNTMLLVGIIVWLVYGIISARISLIIWNALGAVLNGWLLYAKFKYGRESAKK
jgi:MtN3 and saliva related transmembrane protein